MKKLLAMIGAVAMSFGLFADAPAPFAISYEATETDVSEGAWTPGSQWSWEGGDAIPVITDLTRVLPYEAAGTSKARRNDVFMTVTGGTDNDNYADLSTGTDELTLAVDSGNIFLDQLVKFTGFEDPQTNLVSGTKIAIWMSEFENEDESTSTNLYITCGKNVDGTYEQVALQIEGTYKLNTWYRLTVKSLGDIFDGAAGSTARAGFLVWVNGNKATCEDAKSLLGDDSDLITDSKKTAFYNAGRLFPAFAASDALATVGYQGIGAIDDIIVDAEGPEFCVETVDVSFNPITGAVIAKVVDGDGVEFDYPTTAIPVKPGALTVTLEAAEGYKWIGSGTYAANTDDAEEGVITIDAEDDFVEVYATKNDTVEFGADELLTMINGLVDGDMVVFNLDSTIGETVEEVEVTYYSFTAGSTITVSVADDVTTWAIVIAGENAWITDYVGTGADFIKSYTFTEEGGTLELAGDIAGALTAPNVEASTDIEVSGTLKAAVLVIDSTIALAVGGKVMTADDSFDDTTITVPDDYELDISDIDGEGYYTYTAKAVVPPASGFMVILADGTELDPVDTLPEALALIDDGATIKLLADVTDAVGIVVDTKKSFTIDFDSHVYTVNKPGAGSTGTQTSAFQFIKGQTIVLKNGTIQAHVDNLVLAEAPAKNIKRFIQSYADLTLVDMTLDGTNLYLNPADNAMCEFANGEVSIEGATSILANKANLDAISIDTWKGKYPDGVSVTIDTTGTISSVKVWTEGTGDFTPGEVALAGGTITELKVDGNDADYEIAKTGATVAAPAGYTWEGGVLKAYIAQIKNGASFTTLAAAVAAAESGSEIVLLKSASGAGIGLWENDPKTLTLDLGGNTYTCTSPAVGSKGTETQGFHIEQGSALTVKNGTITSSGDEVKMLFQNYVDLTLDGVTLDGSNLPGTGRYVLSNNSGAVILEDCVITAKEGDIAFDTCKYRTYDAPTVEVKGESVINGNVELAGGNLTLTAGTLNGELVDAGVGAGVVTKSEDFDADEPAGYKWEDGVLKQIVATVASGDDTYTYTTAAAALAKVQELEADAANFPIVATALVADLAVVGPNGVTIVLAKDETITINANSWVFSGGATISDGPIALAAGATFTVVGRIANYKTLFSAPADYEVVEIDNKDGTYTYSAAQSAAKVAKIGNVEYTSLGAAIAALTGAGETIELLCDYTAADAESLVFAKDAILDLGEFELTLPTALLGAKAFEVSDGASLVLTNGVITMGDNAYGLQVYGTAIVADGCTMTKLVNTTQGPIFDIYGKGTTSTDGGTVLVEAGAYIESGADVFRHKKNGAGVAAQANIYVTGGTLKAPVTGNYCIFNGSSYLSADDVAVITGGTFLGKFEQTEKWGGMTLLGADAADARFDDTAIVTATARLADGYEFAEAEEDGLWKIVKSPVAEIVGGGKYATLGEAIAALTGGETIKLLANYTAADAENLMFAKDAILDLNGKTLTVPNALRGSKKFGMGAEEAGGPDVTITNGTVALDVAGACGRGIQVYGGTLTVACTFMQVNTDSVTQQAIFDIYSTATVKIEPTAVVDSPCGDVFRSKGDLDTACAVVINGGTITCDDNGVFYASKNLPINVTINAGTINFADTVFAKLNYQTLVCELDDSCEAKFDSTTGLTAYIADGYELVQGADDYYTVQKSPVAEIVGGGKYGTLGEAIAALTGGETIKLLANYTTTENLAFNKTCTLDLNEKTLTIPGDYRGKPLAASASSTAYTGVDAGATLTVTNGSVVLAEKNAGGKVNYGFYVVGKLINYANWTHDNTSGPAIELYEGAEVVQNDGVLTSGDIFRSKDDVQAEAIRTITINGGTMTATGNNAYGYPIIYFTKSGTHNIAINGGTFETAVYAYGVAGDTTNISGLDGDCQAKFKNTVITVAGAKTDLSAYVAAGYELVKGADEYYTIAKIPSFDVTFTQNNEPIAGSTKTVLRDTVLKAEDLPTVEGGTWDVDPIGAVITCNTNFNYTVAVGPDWPEDWPKDVPDTMKEAFKTWAETYGVSTFEGAENAFLMNDDPKAGTVTALEITSIEVADGVATIKVAAGEKNLEEGINGVLFVSATDDLAGEWTTTVVEEPDSFEDEGLTAVFKVEGAQFMKAKVDFKVETPVVKE